MEILQSQKDFNRKDDRLQFHYVTGILRTADGALFLAKWHDRRQKPSTLSQAYDVQPLQTEDRGPAVRPEWTLGPAAAADSSGCFVKTPSLFAFAGRVDIESQMRRELEACEILKSKPHPNIAVYLGYQVARGRVTGLCFRRYGQTLQERAAFLTRGRPPGLDLGEREKWLAGIRAGIDHLHALGLVHNDINPANIMLDADGTPVMIDFDSCPRVGEPLGATGAKRTYYWHDPDVDVAAEKNDLDAWAELRTWLAGSSAEDFLFG